MKKKNQPILYILYTLLIGSFRLTPHDKKNNETKENLDWFFLSFKTVTQKYL
jgi:hypothetical protein